jgi:hypothetical protein
VTQPLFATSLTLFAIVICDTAIAQTQTISSSSVNEAVDRWSKEKGIVITSEVRRKLAADLAFEFTTNAQQAGVSTVEAWQLGGAIASGGTVEYSTGKNSQTLRGKERTGKIIFSADAPRPRITGNSMGEWVLHLTDFFKISSLLQKYPKVHLIVNPVPPRDYSVKINGSTYEATEQSLYGVVSGTFTSIRVERLGKPPCLWAGVVSADDEVQIDCTL